MFEAPFQYYPSIKALGEIQSSQTFRVFGLCRVTGSKISFWYHVFTPELFEFSLTVISRAIRKKKSLNKTTIIFHHPLYVLSVFQTHELSDKILYVKTDYFRSDLIVGALQVVLPVNQIHSIPEQFVWGFLYYCSNTSLSQRMNLTQCAQMRINLFTCSIKHQRFEGVV